jgi:hypothetical protein
MLFECAQIGLHNDVLPARLAAVCRRQRVGEVAHVKTADLGGAVFSAGGGNIAAAPCLTCCSINTRPGISGEWGEVGIGGDIHVLVIFLVVYLGDEMFVEMAKISNFCNQLCTCFSAHGYATDVNAHYQSMLAITTTKVGSFNPGVYMSNKQAHKFQFNNT